jgi:hypothetical protein
MYGPLLLIHSWTRWIVVVSGILFLIRCLVGWMKRQEWSSSENYFIWGFNQILGYQILFGFTLYIAASPYVRMAISNPSLISTNPVVGFWVARHAVTMLSTLGVFHVGRAKAKKAPQDSRFRIYTITFTVLMAMILSAIPWAGLAYGRPWFRWIF